MSTTASLARAPLDTVQLIDHRGIAWKDVRQTRYWLHQRFHYAYPGPIRELRQRLMIIPADHYGDQRLCDFELHISDPAASTVAATDPFGNRVFHVYLPEAGAEVAFEILITVERDLATATLPQLNADEVGQYLAPTALTTADPALAQAAQQLAAQYSGPAQLASAINTWTWEAMRYGAGATVVTTTAAEALSIGQGLCQDYAHIMLALCRAAGLPARYVSGHLLGEGGSHAWVEVLLQAADHSGFAAVAFDPTNHRRATPAYITIAVGRDYSDVSPTSGSFVAPYGGRLTSRKRAGLTYVEYAS